MSKEIENQRKLPGTLISVDRQAVYTHLAAAFSEGGASSLGEELRHALEEIGTA